MEKDGFKLVQRKKGNRKPHTQNKCVELFSGIVEDEEYILNSISKYRKDLENSTFWKSTTAVLYKDVMVQRTGDTEPDQSLNQEQEKAVIEEIVCFGLGSISESVTSRYQLALLLCLKEALQIKNCWLYDPIFGESEKTVMRKLDLQFLQENEEGGHHLNRVTLVYMPHCPRQLFNNLFWANWSPEGLSRLVLLSNSMATITHSTLDRILQQEFSFIYKVNSLIAEREIANEFDFKDIFNDLSLHTFSLSKLNQIPGTVWENLPKPQYSETME